MEHHDCNHSHCTVTSTNMSVCQTLSEMDWERGLWYAAFYGDKDRVKYLIDKAKNIKEAVNAPDNSGYTPLHYAARTGNIDICKILLQNGAIINSQTKSGMATPLHKAAAAGKTDMVKFLIQSGACVEMQDIDGQTVLHKAVEKNNIDLVNYLLTTYPSLAHIKNKKGICAVK
ncbi:ankyrin repeat domain-containing protein 39 [Galleria mellonella]|uniref:Ankyrin repeat domain-containing protein 39 n=1 Tax=Galleria mellonella TaxID=7137 RepID=A0A6J1WVU2_GALME|nr:ankyrin repeat domain-containing protein 39 [Galleria mellonella]